MSEPHKGPPQYGNDPLICFVFYRTNDFTSRLTSPSGVAK